MDIREYLKIFLVLIFLTCLFYSDNCFSIYSNKNDLIKIAKYYYQKNHYDEAKNLAEIVISIDKINEEATEIIINYYLEKKRRKEAINFIKSLYNEKYNIEKKEKLLNRIKIISEMHLREESFKLFQEGKEYFNIGKNKEAIEALEKANEGENENLKILKLLGRAYLLENNYLKAENIFKKILSINEDEESNYYLCITYVMNKENKEAIKIAQKLFEEDEMYLPFKECFIYALVNDGLFEIALEKVKEEKIYDKYLKGYILINNPKEENLKEGKRLFLSFLENIKNIEYNDELTEEVLKGNKKYIENYIKEEKNEKETNAK